MKSASYFQGNEKSHKEAMLEALEAAAEAVCKGCRNGERTNWHGDNLCHGYAYSQCKAQNIYALKKML